MNDNINHITKLPIKMQSNHIKDIAKPKTVEIICSEYGTEHAQKHCSSMCCDGHHAFFCYSPSKDKKYSVDGFPPNYQI